MNAIRVVSWNMAHKKRPWYELTAMDADVALLQQTCKPPADLTVHVEPETSGRLGSVGIMTGGQW